MVVIEEAHSVAPPGRGGLVARMLREARKFGVSVWLVDQRPTNMSQDAIGLCGTLVVGRLHHPEDLSLLGLPDGFYLGRLSAGEWLVRVPSASYSLVRAHSASFLTFHAASS